MIRIRRLNMKLNLSGCGKYILYAFGIVIVIHECTKSLKKLLDYQIIKTSFTEEIEDFQMPDFSICIGTPMAETDGTFQDISERASHVWEKILFFNAGKAAALK